MKTDLELLQILKEEIERLGLTDNPSRTEMQKHYDKSRMPHPNTYVNRFGTWQQALEMIGIDYDGRKQTGEKVGKANVGKRHASTWSNMTREEIIDSALSEIHQKGIRGSTEYQEKRDKDNTPSIPSIVKLTGLKWADLFKLYRERFNVNSDELQTGYTNQKGLWQTMERNEIIKIVTDELERINSDKYLDYNNQRNKLDTPSMSTLVNRGITWTEIKKHYRGEKTND